MMAGLGRFVDRRAGDVGVDDLVGPGLLPALGLHHRGVGAGRRLVPLGRRRPGGPLGRRRRLGDGGQGLGQQAGAGDEGEGEIAHG